MHRARAGCLTALFLAFLVLPSPRAWAQSRHDCEDAKQLPAEADEESRRITCEIPDKYRHDVSMAEFIGKLIRLHDMAAWVTTDALQEIKAFEDVQGQGRGWLTLQGEDDDIEVRYFTEHEGRTSAIASASLDGESFKAKGARKLSPSEPMTEREERLMRAKALALSSEALRLCTNHTPNTVVIESDEENRKEILVFVMSAWVTEDEAPLGGYHMFRINETGGAIVSQFSQTRACPMAVGKQLTESEALTVTHLTSMTPTMFHVFMGLQYRKPIYVSTTQNGLLWRVERGQIFLVNESGAMASHSGSSATPSSTGN